MIRESPCYKCEKRFIECHASCEDYKAYKQAIDELKVQCRKIYLRNDMLEDVTFRRISKYIKKHRRR